MQPDPRKPLLVGETNPYQPEDAPEERLRHYALYPWPRGASGHRMASFVMGLDDRAYLEGFDRIDLCHPRWSIVKARVVAARLLAERTEDEVIVLCGVKVATAFRVPTDPFELHRAPRQPALVVLPHPSGLCRVWHQPDAVARARAVLREAGVLPVRTANGCERRA